MDERLDENYTRTLHAILNKSYKQFPIKWQLYSHPPPISQLTQDKQDMWCTAGEARMSSKIIFFFELLLIDMPVLANQQILTYIQSMWTPDTA